MIVEQVTYDHQITEEGLINVRQITRVIKDGKEIAKTYHRHVVDPNADKVQDQDSDYDELTNEDPVSKLLVGVLSSEFDGLINGLDTLLNTGFNNKNHNKKELVDKLKHWIKKHCKNKE